MLYFMPIWSRLPWVLPAGFKGARDARYAIVGFDVEHVGCRVVVGYVLGIMLGWGCGCVWMGMFADWAVRAVLFYWRNGYWTLAMEITPRSEPQKCEKASCVGINDKMQIISANDFKFKNRL